MSELCQAGTVPVLLLHPHCVNIIQCAAGGPLQPWELRMSGFTGWEEGCASSLWCPAPSSCVLLPRLDPWMALISPGRVLVVREMGRRRRAPQGSWASQTDVHTRAPASRWMEVTAGCCTSVAVSPTPAVWPPAHLDYPVGCWL